MSTTHGHDHHGGHGHSHDDSSATVGRLAVAFALLGVFAVVEIVTGILTRSLSLLSDAGHMVTDVVGLGVAFTASALASASKPNPKRTFGLHRLEILGALGNAVLLLGMAGYVLYSAFRRLEDPEHVLAGPVLIVAVLGLLANIVAFLVLRAGSEHNLNMQAAYLEVLADMFGSVGVIIAALIMNFTGITWIDPVVGVALGAFIVPRTLRIGYQALRVLLQAAPHHVDVARVEADLRALPDVVDVHDLHVWTLASKMEVVSAHVRARTGADLHSVLDAAQHLLREDYHLEHVTLQVEPEAHDECAVEVSW